MLACKDFIFVEKSQDHSEKENSLKHRVVGATVWVSFGHILGQLIRLASNLIMTRLLVPEMFGVMAVAYVILAGFRLFSDIGLNKNIIQTSRADSPVFLSTVWTVQIIRGWLIGLLGVFVAIGFYFLNANSYWVSGNVYADPILPYVIVAISLNAVIAGFNSTKLALANRNLSLGLVVRIELFSQVVGIACMVAWAMVDRTIWALVIGSIVSSIILVVLSHLVCPGRADKLGWDKATFWELFDFGKWIFLSSILGFLAINGDRILLAGLIDSKALGVYVIALFMVQAIQQVITEIISKVAFPMLSEVVRQRPDQLKKVYYDFRKPVDLLLLLLVGFLFVSGHHIIEFLYDDRYLEAAYMLEILSISLFMERYNLVGQCFMAMGKPKLTIPMIASRVAAIFILLPIAYNLYGLEGALWIIATSRFFTVPVLFYLKRKYKILSVKNELMVLPAVLVGAGLGYLINNILFYIN